MHQALILVIPFLLSCAAAASPPPPLLPDAPTVLETHAAVVDAPPPQPPVTVDDPTRVERDASAVFRAMHGDFLRCFGRAQRRAFVTVDVLVGPQGEVRSVETFPSGQPLTTCIARRVARATFPPPRDGGTARVRVPFAFDFDR